MRRYLAMDTILPYVAWISLLAILTDFLLLLISRKGRIAHFEGVGQLAELVTAAVEPDPVGERSVRGDARGVRDAGEGGEHAAREQPASHQPEHEQERHHVHRDRREVVQQVGEVLLGVVDHPLVTVLLGQCGLLRR